MSGLRQNMKYKPRAGVNGHEAWYDYIRDGALMGGFGDPLSNERPTIADIVDRFAGGDYSEGQYNLSCPSASQGPRQESLGADRRPCLPFGHESMPSDPKDQIAGNRKHMCRTKQRNRSVHSS